MKEKLLNYKFLIAHKASSYPYLYTKISGFLTGRDCYTTKNSAIVIDGFPRCANTYATYAFKLAQGKEINIAHHIHKQSQFLIANKYGIPAILLIREPVDCISSLLIRQPKYDPSTLLKGYYYLYNGLRNIDSYVVADFKQVLNNYADVIIKVNQKFGADFLPYIKNGENEASVKQIIHTQDELIGAKDYLQRVAYPTAERKSEANKAKETLTDKRYADLTKRCQELYQHLTSK